MIDSPSYTLNHEEVAKALEEGIVFAEGLAPARIEVDRHSGMRVGRGVRPWHRARRRSRSSSPPAPQPNTVLAREEGVGLELDGKYFLACDETGAPVKPGAAYLQAEAARVLLHRYPDGRFMSFFGDLHPSYFGNVVKAMGSAKQGYPVVSEGAWRARAVLAGRRRVPRQAESRSARRWCTKCGA